MVSILQSSLASLVFILVIGSFSGCGENPGPTPEQGCAKKNLTPGGPNLGLTYVYITDPVTASQDKMLTPTSLKLDEFKSKVEIEHLTGKGVLEGTYVDVRNGKNCKEWFLASEPKNQFLYIRKDFRFQEGMTYYIGDRFRYTLKTLGYMKPDDPVRIVVHCSGDDNSYYAPFQSSDGKIFSKVCLGDSATSNGASYADDAQVTIHELQHSTTVGLYTGGDYSKSFNQLYYDEAGGLNEAISDFVALIFFEPELSMSPQIDLKLFSHWALDRFSSKVSYSRGAHKCPLYIKHNCNKLLPFSAKKGTLSYTYPDGLGWPFPDNFQPGVGLREIFESHKIQEEIHIVSVVMTGALWDAYEALKTTPSYQSPSGKSVARTDFLKLLYETIRRLPLPSQENRSPITFRKFAKSLLDISQEMGFSTQSRQALEEAFFERGLVKSEIEDANWADIGAGTTLTPGVKILDEPAILKIWLGEEYKKWVPQGIQTGINDQLDPGELAVIWFDIKNISIEGISAGGVLVQINIAREAPITFPSHPLNLGAISEKTAQIMLSKINGTKVVSQLRDSLMPENNLKIGNSYFMTNPYFSKTYNTGLWVKVDPNAKSGEIVEFQLEALPSNGVKSKKLHFPITIR